MLAALASCHTANEQNHLQRPWHQHTVLQEVLYKSKPEYAAAAAQQQTNRVASYQTKFMLRTAKHSSMSSGTAQAEHCRDVAMRTKLFQLLNERPQVDVKVVRLTRARHDHEGHGVLSLAPLLCWQIIAAAVNVKMRVHKLLG